MRRYRIEDGRRQARNRRINKVEKSKPHICRITSRKQEKLGKDVPALKEYMVQLILDGLYLVFLHYSLR